MECKVSDLVKRGHDQAAELKASCGAVDVRDVAQLISDLATQLDVQLARSNALAAENENLVNFITDRHWLGSDCMPETPVTSAFLAEVRAQGVEMFAAHKRERQQALRSRSMRMSEEAAGMAADAENFADELRKGVQS